MEDRELGQRIAYWRRRRGLTQVIFADRLGRSKSWIVKVESGQRSAGKLSTLDLICDVLRVDLSTLLGEDPFRRSEVCIDDVEVERIQLALERYVLRPPDSAPLEPDALRRQVAHAWTAFEFADYDMLSLALPGLIERAQQTHGKLHTEDSRQLLAEVYQITSSILRKLGEYNLAWLAGDRGVTLARRNGNIAVVAATGFRIANALLSMGRARQALDLNVVMAESLQGELDTEAHRALYGHILLQASIAAATAGDPATVRDLIAEAAGASRFVTPASNHYRLAFNRTNVILHEVSALLALGDAGRALEASGAIESDSLRLLRKERRAALLVDIARAYSHVGKRDEALRTLLEAEAIASREVRCRPVAQATIADLLRRSYDTPSTLLTQLAARSGVSV
jgi:transcriptional regulator with XRE-family HTH domain